MKFCQFRIFHKHRNTRLFAPTIMLVKFERQKILWHVDPLLGNDCNRHARNNRIFGSGVLCAVCAEAI
jgi:hypothetical protein